MRILTNEYICNAPDFKKPAKGGPANFARLFFNFIRKSSKKHEWIGLMITKSNPNKKSPPIKRLNDRQLGRMTYEFLIPRELTEEILKAKKIKNPREILNKEIEQLSCLIKEINPDIVFLNGFALSNWIILEASHLAKKPIVIQHAGIWTFEVDIYKDFFSPSAIKMMIEMEKDSSRLVDAEIFLNDFSRRWFEKKVLKKAKSKKITKIIPLPVDAEFFKKESSKTKKFKFDKNFFNIGMIARWDRIKNHEAVANLAAMLAKKKIPWKIHSVTQIPDTKNQTALKNKYKKNIDIIEHLTKEKVGDFCKACDLMIIPSIFETAGYIAIEALACGTPTAISSNIGFVDDYLKNGAKDWIIDFNDTKKAIDQITKIKDKPLPEKLKKALLEKHQIEKVFKQYISLFEELIKR